MKSSSVLAMRAAGISDPNTIAILLFLKENLRSSGDDQPHCGLTAWDIARQTGLSVHQVKRGFRSLMAAGAIVRKQLVKAAGEAAITVLTDRARTWLDLDGAGEGGIPADMPRELRELLVFESSAFVDQVAHAWRAYEPLAESLRTQCCLGARAYEQIEAAVRHRLLDAAETVAEAHAEERADREQLEQGIVQFDCEDGIVAFDAQSLRQKGGAVGSVDLLMVRDVLRKVRQRRPGFVTTGRLCGLVAEIGYSRTIGFVSQHDAEVAARILVSTVTRPTWNRPKGIKDKFYSDVASASRFSTGVRHALH